MPVHSKYQYQKIDDTFAYTRGDHKWTIENHKEYINLIKKMKKGDYKSGDILIYQGPRNGNYLVNPGDKVKYTNVRNYRCRPKKLILNGSNKDEYTSVSDAFFVNEKDSIRLSKLGNILQKVFRRRVQRWLYAPVLFHYDWKREFKPDLEKWEEDIEKLSRESRIQEEKKALEDEIEEEVHDDDLSDDGVEFNPFEYRGVTYHRDEEDLYTEDGDYVGYIIIKKEEEKKKEDQLIGYSAF